MADEACTCEVLAKVVGWIYTGNRMATKNRIAQIIRVMKITEIIQVICPMQNCLRFSLHERVGVIPESPNNFENDGLLHYGIVP